MITQISPTLRLLVGIVLTAGVLPYTWDRFLVRWMMDGKFDWLMLVLFVPSLMATMAVTRDLAPALSSKGVRRLLLPTLLVAWVLEHVILVAVSVADSSPRVGLTLLLSASTLWIPWTAWLLYGFLSRSVSVGLLAVFLALGPAFPLLFSVQGLTGEAIVFFSWRWHSPSRDQAGLDLPNELIAAGLADLTRTTPHDFPQFLGPQRRGVLPDVHLARDWSTTSPREVWRRDVGEGWSSFAVVGEYAITQEQRGQFECVTCYRLSDGARVWIHSDRGRYESRMGGDGPRATPTVADGRVYTVGALGLLNCLDGATGKALWSVNILEDNGGSPLVHGVCASPLVVDNLVVVVPTGKEGVSLAAYQRDTGKRVWQGGKHEGSYASPLLAELDGVRQILVHNNGGVAGHDVATGKVLWSFACTNGETINCGMPIVNAGKPGQVFAATGYQTGSTLWKVERSAEGTWVPREVWKSRQMKAKFTSVVLHQGHVYGLDDGYLACVDIATGKSKWKERGFRYRHGQVLLVGDLLLVQAEEGDVCLIEPNPQELRELGRFPALPGKTWNNPALAGRFLLVRNDKEAACFELPLENGESPPAPR